MTNDDKPGTSVNTPQNGASEDNMDIKKAKNTSIAIHAQYVKDISFENPNAPQTLKADQQRPNMDININLDAKKIDDPNIPDLYEVSLMLTASAKNDELTFFIIEISYGILASLSDIPEANHHPLLLIEVPKLGFPYVRQILSNLTAQGGYPPLLINPVDFDTMYMDQFGKKNQTSPDKQENNS